MSALNRICWLEHECQRGRHACAAISFNHQTGVQKYKIVLERQVSQHPYVSPAISHVIQEIKHSCHCHIVTDKGHCNSAGKSVLEFYVRYIGSVERADGDAQRSTTPEAAELLLPPHAPPSFESQDAISSFNENRAGQLQSQHAGYNYIPGKLHDIELLCHHIVCTPREPSSNNDAWQALSESQNKYILLLQSQLVDYGSVASQLESIENNIKSGIQELLEDVRTNTLVVQAEFVRNRIDEIDNKVSSLLSFPLEFGRALQNTHVDLKADIEKLDVARCHDTIWQQYAQTHITLSSMRNEIIQSLDSAVNNLRDEILVSLVKGGTQGVATQTDDFEPMEPNLRSTRSRGVQVPGFRRVPDGFLRIMKNGRRGVIVGLTEEDNIFRIRFEGGELEDLNEAEVRQYLDRSNS